MSLQRERQEREKGNTGLPLGQSPTKRQRRTLSCLPCRLHKLRCNRVVPCQNCCRYAREDQCRMNPPPETVMAPQTDWIVSSRHKKTQFRLASISLPSVGNDEPLLNLPPTPSNDVPLVAKSTQMHNEYLAEPNTSNPGSVPQPASEDQTTSNTAEETVPRPLTSPLLEVKGTISALVFRSANTIERCIFDEPTSYWRQYLVKLLPSQAKCDMLVSYFFENINWMYQAIHTPSFRTELTNFWNTDVDNVDLIWLALLYIILCESALLMPTSVAESVGFSEGELPKLHQRWYAASRQALNAGGYDAKPTLRAVQVFIVSQTYWYCTKNVEALNSHMGLTIRNAQALGLDKTAPKSFPNCVEREIRHRLWWELVTSDTFQALCLGRPALLQSSHSTVPYPENCNDIDITSNAIRPRPISEPTEMSIHCFRARLFKVFNKLCISNSPELLKYDFITQVDFEISEIMDKFPWYLKDDPTTTAQRISPNLSNVVIWSRHLLNSAVHVQRVRMYRPFLNPVVGDSWIRCLSAATSALKVYKSLRGADIARFQRLQKMHIHAYQIFSTAIALATFLLVEMPSNPSQMRSDIEVVIEDLNSHNLNFHDSRRIPLISDGCKVIKHILALYDARCKQRQSDMINLSCTCEGPADSHVASQSEAPTSLIPAISSVFGGEMTARRYLERCSIEHIINGPTPSECGDGTNSEPFAGVVELTPWDAWPDPAQSEPWNDRFWADMNAGLI